jgi:sugar phosphate isomerase/epimerase
LEAVLPDVILFPKFQYLNQDPPLSLESLAQHALSCGFDGVDALIREASWVKESDYAQSLPRFVRGLRAHGLKAYTASTDWGHEHADDIEEAYRLFADNGIRMFRFTMQTYQGPGTWRADLERCRKTLGKLEPLGQRYGVKALLQTHGGLLAFSPATALCLVDGLDPAALGIHYDPGNMLHQEGWTEPVKSVDIMGPYLSYVGVKNCGYFLLPPPTYAILLPANNF